MGQCAAMGQPARLFFSAEQILLLWLGRGAASKQAVMRARHSPGLVIFSRRAHLSQLAYAQRPPGAVATHVMASSSCHTRTALGAHAALEGAHADLVSLQMPTRSLFSEGPPFLP